QPWERATPRTIPYVSAEGHLDRRKYWFGWRNDSDGHSDRLGVLEGDWGSRGIGGRDGGRDAGHSVGDRRDQSCGGIVGDERVDEVLLTIEVGAANEIVELLKLAVGEIHGDSQRVVRRVMCHEVESPQSL